MPYLQEQVQQAEQWQTRNRKWFVVAFLAIMAIAGAVMAYKMFIYKTPPVGIYAPAKPADGMASAPTHAVPSAPLQAYDKKTATKLMGIPEIVLADPSKELVATSKTSKDRLGYSTTQAAIADTTTGKVEIIEKKERSLFSSGGGSEVGLKAGIGTNGYTGSIYARQDLLRVGNIYAAGVGEVSASATRQEAKALFDISYRW